jgi:hypothetical protein
MASIDTRLAMYTPQPSRCLSMASSVRRSYGLTFVLRSHCQLIWITSLEPNEKGTTDRMMPLQLPLKGSPQNTGKI